MCKITSLGDQIHNESIELSDHAMDVVDIVFCGTSLVIARLARARGGTLEGGRGCRPATALFLGLA